MEKLTSVKPVHDDVEPYLQKLRSQYGGTVYPIDRYVEVFRIRENVWAMFAPCTHAVADNWLYLIEGPQKAIFIDNGYGIGDLKGLGESLTGKPVICAVTHSHGDHVGGNPQWEEIYCHKYCAEMLEMQAIDYEGWWKKFNHVGEAQHRHYYRDEDVIPYRPYRALHLENHSIINLGDDYDLELIHVGGHAPGLSCFLDKKSRILYSGDAVFESRRKGLALGLNSAKPGVLHPECMGISYCAKQMEKLAERVKEFDYVMAGHGYVDSPAQCVTDINREIQAVIADPYTCDMVIERANGKRCIKEGGLSDVMYDPEDVVENLSRYYHQGSK
ncbi:MAG: MBL fold metallo-hydrolase [Eubacteriales bacterium]|nr:MBL fold metallo-hydrolase [Eubacteriales bacterium]